MNKHQQTLNTRVTALEEGNAQIIDLLTVLVERQGLAKAAVEAPVETVTYTAQRQVKVEGRWVNDGPKRTTTEPKAVAEARQEAAKAKREGRTCAKSAHVHTVDCVIASSKAKQAAKATVPAHVKAQLALEAKAETLSIHTGTRTEWNHLFVLLSKTSGLRDLQGKTLYRVTQNRWDEVQEARNEGWTVREALDLLMAGKSWAKNGSPVAIKA
jgi:hypothetical protein